MLRKKLPYVFKIQLYTSSHVLCCVVFMAYLDGDDLSGGRDSLISSRTPLKLELIRKPHNFYMRQHKLL